MPPTTAQDLIQRFFSENPGYREFLADKSNAMEKLRRLAREAADAGTSFAKFRGIVIGLQSFQNFSNGIDEGDEAPEEESPVEEEEPIEEEPFPAPEEQGIDEDVRDLLLNFLTDNELPRGLMSFIEDALAQNWSYARIVAELRQTPEYLSAYPEMALRRQNGWDAMTEAEVRAYRSETRRLAQEYFGVTLNNSDIATMLGVRNKSLREYEQDLQVWQQVERWGPAVRQVLGAELGYEPDDELIFAFMHGEINTPGLDRAYSRSLLRGQPAALGLGIRPEEEATILEQFGIDPARAFQGYQEVVGQIGRAERYAAIEAEIGRNIARFPTGEGLFNDTPFSTLFRAIQLGDPESLQKLQGQLAREVARFQAGGSIAQSGSGAAVGLLTAEERARR